MSPSTDTGTGAPPANPRDRPPAVTVRRSTERVVGIELAAGVGNTAGRDGLRLEEQPAVDDR